MFLPPSHQTDRYPQTIGRFPIRLAALRLKSRASRYEVDLRRLASQSTQVDFVNVALEFIRRAGLHSLWSSPPDPLTTRPRSADPSRYRIFTPRLPELYPRGIDFFLICARLFE